MSQLLIAVIFASGFGHGIGRGQLPTLEEKEWLGHFIGYENDKYRFGFTSLGAGVLTPMGKTGPAGKGKQVDVSFVVEEIMPDGKVMLKKLVPESLVSDQKATNKPVDITIRGTVTGGAVFEGTIHEQRGVISLGGKLLDHGTLKNAVRFSIRVEFGAPYRHVAAAEREERVFQKRIRQDELRVIWTDGKRVKQRAGVPVIASLETLNGPGIAEAEFEADAFQGRKFVFETTPGSKMLLSCRPQTLLIDGFSLTWFPDENVDNAPLLRLELK